MKSAIKKKMTPQVDGYLRKAKRWRKELEKLRLIILNCPLAEDFKWYVPCYTFQKSNVVLINGFKEFCALSFFKGALLKDEKRILTTPGENTQVGRWIKFTSVEQIQKLEPVLTDYIHQAIEVEKAGLKVPLKRTADYPVPEEFQKKLDQLPLLKTAFQALTPGRQRGYLLYFAAAKQSKTRSARVEKYTDQILKGKGLND